MREIWPWTFEGRQNENLSKIGEKRGEAKGTKNPRVVQKKIPRLKMRVEYAFVCMYVYVIGHSPLRLFKTKVSRL